MLYNTWFVRAIRWFLGAFAKFRKVTVNFVIYAGLSVFPSACNNSVPTGRIFI